MPMLSLLFAISFKFSRTSKKVVINNFCSFLFLNKGEKSDCFQARSQEFALGGGLFWILKKASNDLDPDFYRCLISLSWFYRVQIEVIQSFILTNLKWDPGEKLQLCGSNNSKSFATSDRQSRWGTIFIFGAKIGHKNAKNVVFCIFFRPMGG